MLTIRNIHKTFGDHTILHGIDLDVAKGSVVVIQSRLERRLDRYIAK